MYLSSTFVCVRVCASVCMCMYVHVFTLVVVLFKALQTCPLGLRYFFCPQSQYACVLCVCPPPRLLLTTHLKWNFSKQFSKCCNFPVSWYLPMGVSLVTKCIMSDCQKRPRWLIHSFYKSRHFSLQSGVVQFIKVSGHVHSKKGLSFKRRLGSSFTVRILTDNFVLLLKKFSLEVSKFFMYCCVILSKESLLTWCYILFITIAIGSQ